MPKKGKKQGGKDSGKSHVTVETNESADENLNQSPDMSPTKKRVPLDGEDSDEIEEISFAEKIKY